MKKELQVLKKRERRAKRDSAAPKIASLGFLPLPLTFSFLLAIVPFCFRSIILVRREI